MTDFIEQDCTVTHEGKSFTAGGASVVDGRIVAYVGATLLHAQRGWPTYDLTDGHGNKIGVIAFTSSWATPRSYVSSRMYQGYATIDGVTYTGRTAGEGMAFTGKVAKGRKS